MGTPLPRTRAAACVTTNSGRSEVGLGIKTTLKAMRASQPFNNLATATLRGLFSVVGHPPEFLIKHLPRTGITSVTLPNAKVLKIEAATEDWIPTQLFWRGWQGYEPETTGLFFRLAQSARTVFDVGAHAGFFCLLAGLANPQADVFAFEPLIRVFESLEHNVRLNGLKRVKCFRMAVGAHDGVQEFYFPNQEQPLASSFRSDMLLATYPPDAIQHVPVSVVTLDRFVADHGISQVDLIKLDTERTEHDVLAGARKQSRATSQRSFARFGPMPEISKQLEDILRPLGYRFLPLATRGANRAAMGSSGVNNFLTTSSRRGPPSWKRCDVD